jgi:hypothetical protein
MRPEELRLRGSWISAVILFLYAIPFSFAYTSLTAGTGALILFGFVQVTMMVAALGLSLRQISMAPRPDSDEAPVARPQSPAASGQASLRLLLSLPPFA